ncbi:MAG: T9SS type A sorting domain-containing protein, partial [Bacteroidota bacterium]
PSFDFRLQPNVVKDVSKLVITGAIGKHKTVSCWDALGRRLQRVQIAPLTSTLPIDAGNWPVGLYWIVLEVNGERVVRKLVKT